MLYQYATCSRLGNRQVNEDRVAVAEHGAAILLVLADGLGGHKGGQIAAQVGVSTACSIFHKTIVPIHNPKDFLQNIFLQAQTSILHAGLSMEPPIEPKCTLVACLVQNGEATWAHVGDSRLYFIRKRFVLEQTRDHSVVEDLFRQGKISERQKSSHPHRNSITLCMGSRQKPATPTMSDTTKLEKDDGILLCTDGFWGQLSESQLRDTFHNENITESLDGLAQKAESSFYPRSDNISAIAFRFIDDRGINSDTFSARDLELGDLQETLDAVNFKIE